MLIISLVQSQPSVRHLRPTVVIASQTGRGTGLTSCAEGVGKKISRDFNLDADQVLWIEHFPSKTAKWHTAVFRAQDSRGSDINYDVRWRPATPNEVDLIKPFVAQLDLR